MHSKPMNSIFLYQWEESRMSTPTGCGSSAAWDAIHTEIDLPKSSTFFGEDLVIKIFLRPFVFFC